MWFFCFFLMLHYTYHTWARRVLSKAYSGICQSAHVGAGERKSWMSLTPTHFIHWHQNSQLAQWEAQKRDCTLLTPLNIQQSSKATPSPTSPGLHWRVQSHFNDSSPVLFTCMPLLSPLALNLQGFHLLNAFNIVIPSDITADI